MSIQRSVPKVMVLVCLILFLPAYFLFAQDLQVKVTQKPVQGVPLEKGSLSPISNDVAAQVKSANVDKLKTALRSSPEQIIPTVIEQAVTTVTKNRDIEKTPFEREQAAKRKLTSTKSQLKAYTIELTLTSSEEVEQARRTGIINPEPGIQRVTVEKFVLHDLEEKGLSYKIIGGVSEFVAQVIPGQTTPWSISKQLGGSTYLLWDPNPNYFLASGASVWVTWTVTSAPADAKVTSVSYRTWVGEEDSGETDFWCSDYVIALSSEPHGQDNSFYRAWDRDGSHSDQNEDDDSEDNYNIYLNWRSTSVFNGEYANQKWYAYFGDEVGIDDGQINYIEIYVYWELPNLIADYTPSGWDAPIIASSEPGTHIIGPDNTALATTYIDFAFINRDADISSDKRLYVYLYSDGGYLNGWYWDGIPQNYYGWVQDYEATFTEGFHTLKTSVDVTDAVEESNEGDNVYEKQYHWRTEDFLRVHEPDGGEIWDVGSTHEIIWYSAGTSGKVNIEYSTNGGASWMTIISNTDDDATHYWTIPNTPSTNCLVRVTDVSGPLTDHSDDPFTIRSIGESISVTSPDGGENWHTGSVHEITWNSSGTSGNVKIEYSINGGSNWSMISSSTQDDGSYFWTIPNTPSSNCFVKITDTDGSPSDQSNSAFSIVEKKRYLAVHIPSGVSAPTIDGNLNDAAWSYANGPEVLARGGIPDDFLTPWNNFSDNRVTWKAVWNSSTNLLYIAVEVQDDVAGAVDNDSENLWQDDTIEMYTDGNKSGGDYNGTYGEAQHWLIRRDNAKHLDFLSGYYTGSAISSAIQFGANGNWVLELSMTVYNYYPSTVKQLAVYDVLGWEVWYNDSDNQHQEGGNWARDHQVGWGYSGFAYYNADFFHEIELRPAEQTPYITVIVPNGGEVWDVGTPQDILWSSSGTSGNVKIEYSTNGGSSWSNITTSTPDDGSFPWTVPNTPSTNCLVKVTDTDGSPYDQSNGVFEIRLIQQHFTPVWTGYPFQPMTIYCTKAMLSGQSLVAGDEVGVFDGTKCVGTKVLSQSPSSSNPVEIICSKDDGSGNGFTEGNTIVFKVWDQSATSEFNTSAQFIDLQTSQPISPVPFTALGTAAVELAASTFVTQSIPLKTGWNIFSLAVIPQGSHDMLDVLSPILNNLVKVIDEQGHSIVKLFGSWTNSIGDWQPTEGYYINVNQDVTLQVTGTEIVTPLSIPLNAGWNIISYPCLSHSQNALNAVQPLISSGNLVKVIDEQGHSIVKIFNNWSNSIGDMLPGEGYYVNVNATSSLTISCGGAALAANPADQLQSQKPKHFQLEFIGYPYEPMNIFVIDVRVDGENLIAGDEIAVYAGDRCVGVSVLNSPLSIDNPIEIIARQDDGNGNGFKAGDHITFRLWRSNTGEELFIDGSGIQYFAPDRAESIAAQAFEGLGTAVAAINLTTTSVTENAAMPQRYQLYQNHPNPFNPTTTISYDLPEATDVRLEIFDLQGNIVRQLVNGHRDAGHQTIEWDGRNSYGVRVVSGIYFYKLVSGKFVDTKKMILTK